MLNLIPSFHSQFNNTLQDFDTNFQRLVNDFFAPNNISGLKNKVKNSGYPKLDGYFTKNNYTLQCTVPGLKIEDLDVEIFEENNVKYIKISGKNNQINSSEDSAYHWREIKRSAFSRTEVLPDNLENDPETSLVDGILTLIWKVKNQLPDNNKNVRKITLKQG